MSYLTNKNILDCSGCRVCGDVCPQNAIRFIEDNEGFNYPLIDSKKCINCGLCERVCPTNFSNWSDTKTIKAFVGEGSEKVIYNSSSGGAFWVLANKLLKEGYSVCGAEFTDSLQVVHSIYDTEEDCEKFRKSKYIQSDTTNCYKTIGNLLKNGKKVLFSGVGCQCAALYQYLNLRGISCEGLITVSVLCHGTGSQTVFNKYISEIEKKYHDKVTSYTFRNKQEIKKKINSRTACIDFASGNKLLVNKNNDAYLKGYYNRLFYRPSCSACKFARPERTSDITLADAWKIEQLYPDYNPLKGVSLILLNTDKGLECKRYFDECMSTKEISTEWALNSQAIMKRPTKLDENRQVFFDNWRKIGVCKAVDKALWKKLLKIKLGNLKKRLLKK